MRLDSVEPVRVATDDRGLHLLTPDGTLLLAAPLAAGWVDADGGEHLLEAAVAAGPADAGRAVGLAGPGVEGRLALSEDVVTGDLVVRLTINTGDADVAGSFLQVRVPGAADLELPAVSGLRFTREHRFMEEFQFDWPRLWNAAMVIAGVPGGGFMLHAEDPEERAKGLHLLREGDDIVLRLRTEEQAPFDGIRRHESVSWRVSWHRGSSWRESAIARYQRWMRACRGEPRPPAWAMEEMDLFASWVPHDRELLRRLARWVPPSATMLHLEDWRRLGYDRGYPDYTARDDLGAMVGWIHDQGFRCMPHTNVLAVDSTQPLPPELTDARIVDRFTREALSWHWETPEGFDDFDLSYLHPAHATWRRELVGRLGQVLADHPFDGLFVDQSHHAYNHAHGLVEGRNVVQGMSSLLEELKDLAGGFLAGEFVNEVSAPHQAVGQIGVLGYGFGGEWAWGEEGFPSFFSDLLTRLFEPWTRTVIHFMFDPPYGGGATLLECCRRIDVLPSLSHPSAEAMDPPSAENAWMLRAAAARSAARS